MINVKIHETKPIGGTKSTCGRYFLIWMSDGNTCSALLMHDRKLYGLVLPSEGDGRFVPLVEGATVAMNAFAMSAVRDIRLNHSLLSEFQKFIEAGK